MLRNSLQRFAQFVTRRIYAIGAKFAFPDRVVIATAGDGAMLMNRINEVVTEWTDPRLIIKVLANRDLNQVTWEQRVMAGDRRYECSQNVPSFEFERYAEMLGLTGIRIDKPDEIGLRGAGAQRVTPSDHRSHY
jgi:pyruvate dehydrogenase (quinone)